MDVVVNCAAVSSPALCEQFPVVARFVADTLKLPLSKTAYAGHGLQAMGMSARLQWAGNVASVCVEEGCSSQ